MVINLLPQKAPCPGMRSARASPKLLADARPTLIVIKRTLKSFIVNRARRRWFGGVEDIKEDG